MHRKVLIAGISGAGKSHMARYFKARGMLAYDGDKVPGLARWVDRSGRAVVCREEDMDRKWLSSHRWVWSERRLRGLLDVDGDVFIFGMAANLYDLLMHFNEAYYLEAKRGLIAKRLKTRKDAFGKGTEQRKMILGWIKYTDKGMRETGFTFVDASLPARRIFEAICRGGKRR